MSAWIAFDYERFRWLWLAMRRHGLCRDIRNMVRIELYGDKNWPSLIRERLDWQAHDKMLLAMRNFNSILQ
jgi:hypothetical protein